MGQLGAACIRRGGRSAISVMVCPPLGDIDNLRFTILRVRVEPTADQHDDENDGYQLLRVQWAQLGRRAM